MRIDEEVEFGRRRHVAEIARAAHQHDPFDLRRERRFLRERERDVGERSERDTASPSARRAACKRVDQERSPRAAPAAAMRGGGRPAPSRPSAPHTNSAVRSARSSGWLAPRNTGTSSRCASSRMRSAFAVVSGSGTLPATVVMPTRSSALALGERQQDRDGVVLTGIGVDDDPGSRHLGVLQLPRAPVANRGQCCASHGHHDEMGEVVRGESRGGPIGDLAAALEHDDARRHVDDFRHVVADEDHRRAAAMELADEVQHLAALGDAQRGGRLVHDHEARIPVERAGDRHGLPLAAGQPLDRRDRCRGCRP